MTNSTASTAPVPAPPAKPQPASREELLALLSGGHGNFTVTVK